MKASLHLGHGKAKHNDRQFDLDKADHIDQERQNLNSLVIWSQNREDQKYSFEEWERKYYEDHYSESLTATNEKYLAQRHPEKVRTMEDWLKTYKPTEAIIQLGNEKEQVDHQYLIKSAMETINEIKAKYPQFVPLDLALHRDETTPHIHLRFVIEGHDKSGHLKPLKTQGLKEMGIERPDLSQPEGRHNNPLMSFTNEVRETLYRKIEELGLDLDRTPHPNQEHEKTLQYKKNELVADIESLERERSAAEVSFKAERERMEHELDELKLDYDFQAHELEVQFQNEQANLEAQYTEKKKAVLQRQSELVEREKSIEGRELKLDELKELEQKSIWSSEDKRNILKTAKLSAKHKENNINLTAKNKDLSEQVEVMTPNYEDYSRVVSQVHYRDNTMIPKLKNEIENLKQDLQVRNDFIERMGIKEQFLSFCTEIGYKIKTAIQNLDFGISR